MDKLDEIRTQEFYQINSIFMRDGRKEISREFSDRFYTYFKGFYKDPYKFERYCLGIKNIFALTGAEGKKVIDIGCGFGLVSILMVLFGVGEIVGIDESPDMIKVFNKLISRLKPPLKNIRAEVGDALNLHYKNAFFDVVIANSVLTHLRELSTFFIEANRVLKKGGKLYIAMDNNSLDVRGRIFRRRFWRMVEFGPVDTDLLPCSFFKMRKGIIKQNHPLMKEEDLIFLAKETQGMWGEQILKAVEEFLRKGEITQKPLFKYRDPRSGQLPEAELSPFKLIKLLKDFGFETKIIPPFSCYFYPFKNFTLRSKKDISPIMKIYLKKIAKLCYPVSLLASPAVEIIATKNE